MEALAVVTPCRRGEVVYASGDPVEHWYRIVSGLARKRSVTTDGRRQILDFLLPGDFFGFNAREKHPVTVEAVVEGTVVARYPRKRIESLANTDPEVGRYIRQMAFQALSRSQARMLILGRGTALDKVRSFLVELGRALAPRPRRRVGAADVAPGNSRLSRPLGRRGQPGVD
jgi:CRP-like cAMP-binding protein